MSLTPFTRTRRRNRHVRRRRHRLGTDHSRWTPPQPSQNAGRPRGVGGPRESRHPVGDRPVPARLDGRQAPDQAGLAVLRQRPGPRQRGDAGRRPAAHPEAEQAAFGGPRLDRRAGVPHPDGGCGDEGPGGAPALGELHHRPVAPEPEQFRGGPAEAAGDDAPRWGPGDPSGRPRVRPRNWPRRARS